jgi:hypothetical protein
MNLEIIITRKSRTRFYVCGSKIFAIAFVALWLLLAAFTVIYQWCHGLPTSGNRWCWLLLSCNQNIAYKPVICWHTCACAIACKITVSNTGSLYWKFHNIQYRHRGLLSEGHNIPCTKRTPILEGEFLSKSAAYSRANTVTVNWQSTNFSRNELEAYIKY